MGSRRPLIGGLLWGAFSAMVYSSRSPSERSPLGYRGIWGWGWAHYGAIPSEGGLEGAQNRPQIGPQKGHSEGQIPVWHPQYTTGPRPYYTRARACKGPMDLLMYPILAPLFGRASKPIQGRGYLQMGIQMRSSDGDDI